MSSIKSRVENLSWSTFMDVCTDIKVLSGERNSLATDLTASGGYLEYNAEGRHAAFQDGIGLGGLQVLKNYIPFLHCGETAHLDGGYASRTDGQHLVIT